MVGPSPSCHSQVFYSGTIIIAMHAMAEMYELEEKEIFYAKLDSIVDLAPHVKHSLS